MADVTQTPANVRQVSSEQASFVQLGETVSAGDWLYRKTTDNRYWLADADAVDTAKVAGMALVGGDAANWTYIADKSGMIVDVGASLTQGEIYFASNTGGNMMPDADLTTGEYVTKLGVGNSDGNLVIGIHVSGVAVP